MGAAILLPTSLHAQTDMQHETQSTLVAVKGVNQEGATAAFQEGMRGWFEASTDTSQLGARLRANCIQLSPSDSIVGSIQNVSSPLTIYLLRSGMIVGKTQTDDLGSFELKGVAPGPYTVVGTSNEDFFSYSIAAIAYTENGQNLPQTLQTSAIHGRANKAFIAKIVAKSSPMVQFRDHEKFAAGETSSDPPELLGWKGLQNFSGQIIAATTVQQHAIQLQNGGKFFGRIHQMHNRSGRPVRVINTRVIVIQDGQMVAETQVNTMGVFEIGGLVPGTYGLLAFGSDGFLATSFELVAEMDSLLTDSRLDASSPFSFSSARIQEEDAVNVFDGTLADPESMGWINAHVQEEAFQQAIQEPMPQTADLNMGQFGEMPYDYFSMGGGGGYNQPTDMGLGGIGSLIVPAAIGWVIADANDKQSVGPIILASPFSP